MLGFHLGYDVLVKILSGEDYNTPISPTSEIDKSKIDL